jgi:hypothetical protein
MEFEDFKKFAKENKRKKCLIIIDGLNHPVEARIQQKGGLYFLCSDSKYLDGLKCEDKLGYEYSWVVGDHWALDEAEIIEIKPAEPFISEDDF